jgi:hypothetical protein
VFDIHYCLVLRFITLKQDPFLPVLDRLRKSSLELAYVAIMEASILIFRYDADFSSYSFCLSAVWDLQTLAL